MLNLVLNASEAIGPVGGVINVSTGLRRLDENQAGREFDGQGLAPGMFATLEVADNGPGMPQDLLERIFDPFFTTKFPGRGLGLSVVRGILKSHQGGIRVSSEPGRGSAFTLVLPAAAQAGPEVSRAAAGPEAGTAFRGSGTVLVVDDEDALRSMAVRVLRHMGFETLEARDGAEALDVHEAHWHRITLILMDLTMPRMGGEEALRELRAAANLAPVILSSGFGPDEALQRFRGLEPAGFLQKPYRYQGLEAAVRTVLERTRGTAVLRGNPPRELVSWSAEFETGLPALDDPHREMVKGFNRLVAATEGKADAAAALGRLLDALERHFLEEDALMRTSGFPQAAQHQALHAFLVQWGRGLEARVAERHGAVGSEGLNDLEDRLMDHILLEDRGLAKHLQGGGFTGA
jgi:hemerythrin-like metal-binding protein